MCTEINHINEVKALTRQIKKFSDLENSLKWLLNKEVVPANATYMLQSFAAHLYTKYINEEDTDTVADVLERYNSSVLNKTSTWFDLTKTEYIDNINRRVDDLLLKHNRRKETV